MEFILKVKQNHIFQLIYSKRKYLLYGSLFFLLLCIIPIKTAQASVAGWIIENTLGVIILWIADSLAYILNQLAGVVAYIMNATDVSEVPAITESWKVVRDGVNITFIAVLLVAGVFNIIHYEPDTYALKEYMPNFVIAVIGVNFSKVMCLFILDFVNVLTASIYTFIGGAGKPMSGNEGLGMYGQNVGYVVKNLLLWDNVGSTSFYDRTVSPNAGTSLSGAMNNSEQSREVFSSWDQTIKVFLVIISLVVLILVFLQLIGVFFVRLIKLWVLIAVSPLFFMGLSSSFLTSISDSWWESFWKYASIPIKVSAFISMGLLLAQKINESALSGTSMLANNEALLANGESSAVINSLVSYLILVGIVVGTLYSALDAASDDGPGSKIGEWLQKPLRGIGSFAGGAAMGAAGVAGGALLRLPVLPSTGALRMIGVKHGYDWLQKGKNGSFRKWLSERAPIKTIGELSSMKKKFISAKDYAVMGSTIKHTIDHHLESIAEDRGGGQAEAIMNAWGAIPLQEKMFGAKTLSHHVREANIASRKKRAQEHMGGLEGLSKDDLIHHLIEKVNKNATEDDIEAHLQMLAKKGWLHTNWDTIAKGLNGKKFETIMEHDGKKEIVEQSVNENDPNTVKSYFSHIFQEQSFSSDLNRQSLGNHNSNVSKYRDEAVENYDGIGKEFEKMLMDKKKGYYVDEARFEGFLQAALTDGKSTTTQLLAYMAKAKNDGLIGQKRFTTLANQMIGNNMAFEFMRDFSGDLSETMTGGPIHFKSIDGTVDKQIVTKQDLFDLMGSLQMGVQSDLQYKNKNDLTDNEKAILQAEEEKVAHDRQIMSEIRAKIVMTSGAVSERLGNQFNIQNIDKDFMAELIPFLNEGQLMHTLQKASGVKKISDPKVANIFAGVVHDLNNVSNDPALFDKMYGQFKKWSKALLVDNHDMKYDQNKGWVNHEGKAIDSLANFGENVGDIMKDQDQFLKFLAGIQIASDKGVLKEKGDMQATTIKTLIDQKVVVAGQEHNALDYLLGFSKIIEAQENNGSGATVARDINGRKEGKTYQQRNRGAGLINVKDVQDVNDFANRLRQYQSEMEYIDNNGQVQKNGQLNLHMSY